MMVTGGPGLQWTVNDGDADSNTLAATVTYTPVNDVPVITALPDTERGSDSDFGPGQLRDHRSDNGSFTYTVSGISGGYFH